MNIPNAITVGRLVLVPLFAWLLVRGEGRAAVGVFALAALSDGVDGFLARVLDQRTRTGAILDPLADKLLGLTALVLLVLADALPAWLLGLSLGRDATVLGFGLYAQLRHKPVDASPTRMSKYATFGVMALTVVALLAEDPELVGPLRPWVPVVLALTSLALLLATAQYLDRWRRMIRVHSRR